MISIKPISSKQAWPIRHTVLYRQRENSEIKILDDAEGLHFGLYNNDELVSVLSWFQEKENAVLRKFGTVASMQNKGYGAKLLRYVIEYSKAKKIKILYCNASSSLVSYYLRFGFKLTGRQYQHDGSFFSVMELKLF